MAARLTKRSPSSCTVSHDPVRPIPVPHPQRQAGRAPINEPLRLAANGNQQPA